MLVGLTGGIGSGKSLVSKIFACLGVPVYEADSRAKWLLTHNEALKEAICQLLGKEAYQLDGSYNRAWVASQVFGNQAKLQALNGLVHPVVFADGDEWVKANAQQPYLIYEAALIKGGNKRFDKMILVYAPTEMRMARTLKRDPQRNENEIRAIINKQTSDEEWLSTSNYVIYNDDSKLVIPQVMAIHKQLSSSL
jgi:dephospho-CoA kinase